MTYHTRECVRCGEIAYYHHSQCSWECDNPQCYVIRFDKKGYVAEATVL